MKIKCLLKCSDCDGLGTHRIWNEDVIGEIVDERICEGCHGEGECEQWVRVEDVADLIFELKEKKDA